MSDERDIELNCPHCGVEILFPALYAGTQCECPECGGRMTIAPGGGSGSDEAASEWAVVVDEPADEFASGPPRAQTAAEGERKDYFPRDPYGLCYVCAASDERLRFAELVQAIVAVTRQDLAIVNRTVRQGRGVLACISAEHAANLKTALEDKGQETFVVDAALVPTDLPLQRVFRAYAVEGAFTLKADMKGTFRSIPWRGVLALGAGIFVEKSESYRPSRTRVYYVGHGVGGSGAVTHKEPGRWEKKVEENIQLHLVAQDELYGGLKALGVTLDRNQIDYDCLGDQKTASGTTNLKLFTEYAIGLARSAFVPPRTQDFLFGNRFNLPRFSARREIEWFHRWMLCSSIAMFGPMPGTGA